MKQVSNIPGKVAASSLIVSIIGLLVAPMGSFALSPHAATAASASKSQANSFCTNLANHTDKIATGLSDRSGKVTPAWSKQDQKLTAGWQKTDQTVAADRQKADSDLNADFTKLEAKAKTDNQKQAVQTYEAAVHNAIATRRDAYDAARQAFRTGVQDAVSGRHDTVTAQLDTFQSSVSSAISTAKDSCTANPNDAQVIRQTLRASLKSARTTFQIERKADNTVGSQVKQLVVTRKAAFKAADKAFQDSLSTARQALKQAFGNSNSI
jgi:hypothetical protein